MRKITFITGGARSGKSRWAVSHFARCNGVKYMCTCEELDEEVSKRIDYFRSEYGVNWEIITNVEDPMEYLDGHSFIIFDNLAKFASRIIKNKFPDDESAEKATHDDEREIESEIIASMMKFIDEAKVGYGELLIVSAEVGFTPALESEPLQRLYRNILSIVNQRIANQCSESYLVLSGKALKFSD